MYEKSASADLNTLSVRALAWALWLFWAMNEFFNSQKYESVSKEETPGLTKHCILLSYAA